MMRRTVVSLIARAALVALGLVLALLVTEAALRIVYIDAGTRTLGGPGGLPFEHETTDGVHRGRLDTGANATGVPRVMILGDSITYGLGVRDWRATWPELLAQRLERQNQPHQFAVLAVPGNDMPQHLEMARTWIGRVQPDVLIYQWYPNDIEAISHRPESQRVWHRAPWHTTLREVSYLYFVVDHRLSQFVSRPDRTYVDYLRGDFTPGSLEWTEFEREFHEFALLAMRAPRRIMMLYPQVPFDGPYPLQDLHDRMRALAGAHAIDMPPISWLRASGSLITTDEAQWGQVVRPSAPTGTLDVQTHDYVCAPGVVELRLQVAGAPQGQTFGTVELLDVAHHTIAASAPLRGAAKGDDIRVRLMLPGDRLRRLAVHVQAHGDENLGLANISIPVDYGFEVIDLTDDLNSFDTHTSSFDSHPNERAHRVMADIIHTALTKEGFQHPKG